MRPLLLGGVAAGLSGAVIWGWSKLRRSPVELERRRRLILESNAKMGDGTVTDVRDGIVYYSYTVRGVAYVASQDISKLPNSLPADPSAVLGPVSVKYDPRNPANSVVVSENWTGLRAARRGNLVQD